MRLIVLFAVVGLAACGGSSPTAPTVPDPAAKDEATHAPSDVTRGETGRTQDDTPHGSPGG